MSLQKQVNLYPDIAIEGALWRTPIEATAGLAGTDVVVGTGCFSIQTTGIGYDIVQNAKGEGVFAGFAYKANLAPNFDITSEASMIVPKGFNVSILIQGNMWVKNGHSNVAKMGSYVFVSDGFGIVQVQDTKDPIVGFTFTDYRVIGLKTDGSNGSLILISNSQGI